MFDPGLISVPCIRWCYRYGWWFYRMWVGGGATSSWSFSSSGSSCSCQCCLSERLQRQHKCSSCKAWKGPTVESPIQARAIGTPILMRTYHFLMLSRRARMIQEMKHVAQDNQLQDTTFVAMRLINLKKRTSWICWMKEPELSIVLDLRFSFFSKIIE